MIPDDQYSLYQAGRYHDVPVLIGYNSDEGATFGVPRSQEAYVEGVRQRYGQFADELLSAYPGGETPAAKKTARDLTRDTAFGWHTWTWARLQSKNGRSKVFLYYFDEHPDYDAVSPRARAMVRRIPRNCRTSSDNSGNTTGRPQLPKMRRCRT